jgi:hypothetical protein
MTSALLKAKNFVESNLTFIEPASETTDSPSLEYLHPRKKSEKEIVVTRKT